MKPDFRKVAKKIRELVDDHGCVMMKLATEDEALTQDELRARIDNFAQILPIEVKIGGPGARGDLEFCRSAGIHHIIAPMVESPYALHDFLAGAREIYGEKDARLRLGVNIETVTAAKNVAAILAIEQNPRLAQVTVGRGDLSQSMKSRPDSPDVMKLARRVLKAARGSYATSVGGGVEPGNVERIAKELRPEFVNTRNFAFRSDASPEAIREALRTEILLCQAGGTKRALARIASLKMRINS